MDSPATEDEETFDEDGNIETGSGGADSLEPPDSPNFAVPYDETSDLQFLLKNIASTINQRLASQEQIILEQRSRISELEWQLEKKNEVMNFLKAFSA